MTTIINKNSIKAVVFDLDGTLLNTIATIGYYLNLSLKAHGLPTVTEAEAMSFVGDGAVKLIERAMERVGADKSLFDSVFKVYNDAYNGDPYYLTEPYEGIPELVTGLKSAGVRLCILSNKPDLAVRAAAAHFFPHCFDLVCGGREGVALKPNPDALTEIISSLGLTPDEVCYIGDSEVDVLTAKNSGVRNAVFVTWGFRTREQLVASGATVLCDTPDEISEKIMKR